MGELINLNRHRKNQARAAAERQAAENRRRYGLRKDERDRAKREAEKANKDLNDKRLD